MKDQTQNSQRLSCPECDAAIDLYHFPQCSLGGTVMNFHCKYQQNYKLHRDFDRSLGVKNYGRLLEKYLEAKARVKDIEGLCEEHGVTLP